MDRDIFQSTYKADVVFRQIPLFPHYIDGMNLEMNTFTIKDWYNVDTKYELYAGKLELTFQLFSLFIFFVSAESGYRKFFDIERNAPAYENGGYAKISFGMFGDEMGFMVFYESGSKPFFDNTTLGFIFGFRLGRSASRMDLSLDLGDTSGLSALGRWHPER